MILFIVEWFLSSWIFFGVVMNLFVYLVIFFGGIFVMMKWWIVFFFILGFVIVNVLMMVWFVEALFI